MSHVYCHPQTRGSTEHVLRVLALGSSCAGGVTVVWAAAPSHWLQGQCSPVTHGTAAAQSPSRHKLAKLPLRVKDHSKLWGRANSKADKTSHILLFTSWFGRCSIHTQRKRLRFVLSWHFLSHCFLFSRSQLSTQLQARRLPPCTTHLGHRRLLTGSTSTAPG